MQEICCSTARHPCTADRRVECRIRRSIHMHVVALLNDTVGTLAAGRHQCPDTLLSIILGTGEPPNSHWEKAMRERRVSGSSWGYCRVLCSCETLTLALTLALTLCGPLQAPTRRTWSVRAPSGSCLAPATALRSKWYVLPRAIRPSHHEQSK